MTEFIKLKVPAKPDAEFVSQGNFEATLEPKGTVKTKSRKFADFLISEHGLTEISETGPVNNPLPVDPLEAEYDAKFPGRKALIAAHVPFETVKNLELDQLMKIKGIKATTAKAILAWQPATPVDNAAVDESKTETNEEQN